MNKSMKYWLESIDQLQDVQSLKLTKFLNLADYEFMDTAYDEYNVWIQLMMNTMYGYSL